MPDSLKNTDLCDQARKLGSPSPLPRPPAALVSSRTACAAIPASFASVVDCRRTRREVAPLSAVLWLELTLNMSVKVASSRHGCFNPAQPRPKVSPALNRPTKFAGSPYPTSGLSREEPISTKTLNQVHTSNQGRDHPRLNSFY